MAYGAPCALYGCCCARGNGVRARVWWEHAAVKGGRRQRSSPHPRARFVRTKVARVDLIDKKTGNPTLAAQFKKIREGCTLLRIGVHACACAWKRGAPHTHTHTRARAHTRTHTYTHRLRLRLALPCGRGH